MGKFEQKPQRNFGKKPPVKKPLLIPHRFDNIFVLKQNGQSSLVTKSFAPGVSVYNEKRVTIQKDNSDDKTEYRIWNPYRSKLAAAILGGVSQTNIKIDSKVLYLGASCGTSVSHLSDICENGTIYAVEFAPRVARELVNMCKMRTNVIPIVGDARQPSLYRNIVQTCDVVFADVAQRDQARIIAQNCKYYLKNGGTFIISIKASCIDSTNEPEVVFEQEVQQLKQFGLKPEEQITLEPYERDHCVVIGKI